MCPREKFAVASHDIYEHSEIKKMGTPYLAANMFETRAPYWAFGIWDKLWSMIHGIEAL